MTHSRKEMALGGVIGLIIDLGTLSDLEGNLNVGITSGKSTKNEKIVVRAFRVMMRVFSLEMSSRSIRIE